MRKVLLAVLVLISMSFASDSLYSVRQSIQLPKVTRYEQIRLFTGLTSILSSWACWYAIGECHHGNGTPAYQQHMQDLKYGGLCLALFSAEVFALTYTFDF